MNIMNWLVRLVIHGHCHTCYSQNAFFRLDLASLVFEYGFEFASIGRFDVSDGQIVVVLLDSIRVALIRSQFGIVLVPIVT